MLKLLPFSKAYSNVQKAAPVSSILGRGGGKKERLFIGVSGVNLHDNLNSEKMRYAVAGKIITRDEAAKVLNKKGLQKHVVIAVEVPKADGSADLEQKFALVNKASFAKRHGLSLWKVHQAAKASNKALREAISKNSITLPETPFEKLAEKRIQEEAEGQKIIEEACRILKINIHATPKDKLAESLKHYRKESAKIPDKTVRKNFQGMLNKIQNTTDYLKGIVLESYQNSLGWNPIGKGEDQKKDFEFRSAMWDQMGKIPPIPGSGDIVLSGCVMGDGKGDYVHMTNMAKKLHKQFPDKKIHLIVVADERHKEGGLKIPDPDICTTHIAYDFLGIISGKTITKNLFETDLGELIKKSDLWISGPVSIIGLYDQYSKEALNGIDYTEYDAEMVSGEFGLKLRLGLGSLGIFTKKPKDTSWSNLESEALKEQLFNTKNPTQKEIDAYLAKANIFMCYQSREFFLAHFLNSAIEFSTLKDPAKDIDVCVPGQKKITEKQLRSVCDLEDLKKKGFASVKYIYYENNQPKELVIPIQDKGKVLRVIDPGFLSKKDFNGVTYLSAPLMGCTGDHSLALALSYGKIPQYEFHGHKMHYMRYLAKICEDKFGKDAPLTKFLDYQPIEDPAKVIEQAKQIGEIIRKEHSFNRYLKGVVNERLIRSKDSDFAQFEDQLQRNYLSGNLSLKEAETQMHNELKRRGLE